MKIGMKLRYLAPIVYGVLQASNLAVYGYVNPSLFDFSTLSSYYFLFIVLMTFVLYGFTSYRDPGYLVARSQQVTEISHQMTQKKKMFQFQALPSNVRTYPILEPSNHGHQSGNEQEMQCEQSIDENQLPEFDINQIPSFTKTPDKCSSPQKDKSQMKQPSDFHSHQPSTQAFSINSACNEQDAIVQIHDSNQLNEDAQEKQKSKKKSEEKRKSLKKETSPGLVLQVQVQSVQNEILSEQYSPGSHRIDITQSSRAMNKLYIEKRYCPICQIDQLVRTKHCSTCNKCVACFDHHCPWSGNCIGERNKCLFYWFLVFQIQEIYCALISTLTRCDLDNQNTPLKIIAILVFIVTIFFGILVTSLIGFHTFFILSNLTTWEFHSWNKISYLKELPKQRGSPFSYGWKQNLRVFCRFTAKQLMQWEYNPKRVLK